MHFMHSVFWRTHPDMVVQQRLWRLQPWYFRPDVGRFDRDLFKIKKKSSIKKALLAENDLIPN